MRASRFPLVLFCLISLATCVSPPGEAPTASEETTLTPGQVESLTAEVGTFIGNWTEAMNAHDPERLLGLYSPTGEFIYVGCTDLMFGFESFSARVAPYYRNRTDLSFRHQVLGIQIVDQTTAVATLRGGSTDVENLFWTLVLNREEDGTWLIAHEHESWPGCPEPQPVHPTGDEAGPGEEG